MQITAELTWQCFLSGGTSLGPFVSIELPTLSVAGNVMSLQNLAETRLRLRSYSRDRWTGSAIT